MVEIPAVDDPRIFIPITVALKGGKTLALSVPRFDFVEEPEHEAMTAELGKLDNDTELSPRQRARLATLVMLKACLPVAVSKRCEALTIGQLNAIREHWIEQSSIPLGEFLASAQSSKTATSEAPPNTTSTPADTTAATLGAA